MPDKPKVVQIAIASGSVANGVRMLALLDNGTVLERIPTAELDWRDITPHPPFRPRLEP